jgi:hypothetical protein
MALDDQAVLSRAEPAFLRKRHLEDRTVARLTVFGRTSLDAIINMLS